MWCGPQCEVGWSQPCIRAPQAGDRDPLVARRGRRPVTGRARTGVPGRVLRRGGRRCMRAGSRRRRRGRPERLQRRRQRRRRRQRAAQPRGRGGARGGARASRLHSALRCSGGCRSRRERVQPGSRPRRRRRLRQRQPQARALARARRAAPAGGALLHDGAGVGRRSARPLPCLAFAAGCGGITGTAEPAARAVGGLGGGRRRHGAGRRRRSGRGQPCRRGRGRSCRRGRWRRARGGPRLRSRAQGLGPRLRLLPPEGFQLRARTRSTVGPTSSQHLRWHTGRGLRRIQHKAEPDDRVSTRSADSCDQARRSARARRARACLPAAGLGEVALALLLGAHWCTPRAAAHIPSGARARCLQPVRPQQGTGAPYPHDLLCNCC